MGWGELNMGRMSVNPSFWTIFNGPTRIYIWNTHQSISSVIRHRYSNRTRCSGSRSAHQRTASIKLVGQALGDIRARTHLQMGRKWNDPSAQFICQWFLIWLLLYIHISYHFKVSGMAEDEGSIFVFNLFNVWFSLQAHSITHPDILEWNKLTRSPCAKSQWLLWTTHCNCYQRPNRRPRSSYALQCYTEIAHFVSYRFIFVHGSMKLWALDGRGFYVTAFQLSSSFTLFFIFFFQLVAQPQSACTDDGKSYTAASSHRAPKI